MVEKGSKQIKLYSKTALDYIYIAASFPVMGKQTNKQTCNSLYILHKA